MMQEYRFESLEEAFSSVLDINNPAAGVFHKKRIVDPSVCGIAFEGLECRSGSPGARHCFEVWSSGEPCENCISARAIREKAPMVKLESNGRDMCVVAACPILVEGKWYSLEMIHDSTQTIMISLDKDMQLQQANLYISQISELIFKDPLTGLFNRRFIDERLPLVLSQSRREGSAFSLIMADIDDFKKVNDTFGHPAGDRLLRSIALILLGHVHTQTDWVARYGGEEFLVCLRGSGRENALSIAEKMRSAVSGRTFYFEGERIHITASFGVHTVYPQGEDALDAIVAKADALLLKAKKEGKNRAYGDPA